MRLSNSLDKSPASSALPVAAPLPAVPPPAPFDIPVGAEVMFHLHNHGYNSWNLFKLEGETPVE